MSSWTSSTRPRRPAFSPPPAALHAASVIENPNACVQIQSTFSFNATYFLFTREETPLFMTSRGSHESENSPTQESWTPCRGVCSCRSRWWKLALLQRLCCSGGRAPQTLRLPDQSDVDQLLPTWHVIRPNSLLKGSKRDAYRSSLAQL